MDINLSSQVLSSLALIVATPTVCAVIGTSVAAMLAQDGFSKMVNGVIAWFVVLFCAAASVYASEQFVGDPTHIISAVEGAATLLISGSLSSLKPYLIYLNFLETHTFQVVRKPVVVGEDTHPMPSVKATVHDWTKGPDGGTGA